MKLFVSTVLFTIFFLILYIIGMMVAVKKNNKVNHHLRNMAIYALVVFVFYYLASHMTTSKTTKESYSSGNTDLDILCYPNSVRANALNSYLSDTKALCMNSCSGIDNSEPSQEVTISACPQAQAQAQQMSALQSFETPLKATCS